ncbi:hypothetical protein HID58_012463 [Brassica napus]|uniref:KIB1-4 beta-propeller domain-containing protein n=1 Tax=Brassica napus TaxID=3708 RepID=A0ABQ8E3T7_BRANA|nr:hypothetical protein HID58_012463 [Brassica napus]
MLVRESMSYIWNFKIYKMGLSKGSKWEEVVTLANEAILLELGITVLANDMEGIKRNSIYFNCSDLINPYDENEIFIFNLDTKKLTTYVSNVSKSHSIRTKKKSPLLVRASSRSHAIDLRAPWIVGFADFERAKSVYHCLRQFWSCDREAWSTLAAQIFFSNM